MLLYIFLRGKFGQNRVITASADLNRNRIWCAVMLVNGKKVTQKIATLIVLIKCTKLPP